MKWGLRSSGPREPIRTIICRGGHVEPRCPMPVLVFLGSSVWELCGAQILGFAFKTYIAYNNLPCTTVLACEKNGTSHLN